jgi:hypothetical protein
MILVPSRSWDSHLYLIYGFFRTLFTSLYCRMLPPKTFQQSLGTNDAGCLRFSREGLFMAEPTNATRRLAVRCTAQMSTEISGAFTNSVVRRSRLQLPMDIWISGRQNAILEFCSLAIPDSLQDKPVFQITRLDKHIKPKPPFSSSNSTGKFGYRNQSMEHQHHVLLVPSRITAVCHSQRQIHPEQYTVFLAHEKAFMMFWREASLAAHHRSTIV